MRLSTILKLGLLTIEVLKIMIFATAVILEAKNASVGLMIFLGVQGTVFPVMALFLCIDSVRFREYLPLLIAGKTVGIFVILGWLLFSQQSTIITGFISETTIVSFDLFALAAAMVIRKDVKRLMSDCPAEAPQEAMIESDTLQNNKPETEEN